MKGDLLMTQPELQRDWRFIDSGSSDGFTNMAIDEAILKSYEKGLTPPTLRVYEWDSAALSVGFFQSITEDVDQQKCLEKGIDVVRRTSGGRSVLHKDELTYSVVASGKCGFGHSVVNSYKVISQGLIAAYRILGLDVHLAPHRGNPSAAACFNAASFGDLTCQGRKIAGSAQFRRGEVLLQHGSLPISIDASLLFSLLRFPTAGNREKSAAVFSKRATCLNEMLGRRVSRQELKEALFQGFQEVFGIKFHMNTLSSYEVNLARTLAEKKHNHSIGGSISMSTDTPEVPSQRLPKWLVRPVCQGKHLNEVRRTLSRLRLHTVCESALCPNMSECFSRGTATFMIMGNSCTRNCRFCAVDKGCLEPLDPGEPARVAEATGRLGLDHVVVTSVTRDDLPGGGANHFACTIRAIRKTNPDASIEVLVPDFAGSKESVETVVGEKPDVFNHNLETIPRLYKEIRPEGDYQRSLGILKAVKQIDPNMVTKSGLMLGLGETDQELLEVLKDLRQAGCDILTLGQYLRPSDNHASVMRFITPEEFSELAAKGKELGFSGVVSAPLVRSSYQSGEIFRQVLHNRYDADVAQKSQ